MKKLLAATAVALVAAALPARAADVFDVDKTHSEVSFKITHLLGKVPGRFDDFKGVISFDKAKPANSSVEFTIQATSIDTSNADRDKHLRSPDFFDVEKFPEITFKSTAVKAVSKDKYQVTGAFTLHGVTKTITLPVAYLGELKDPWGNTRAGFSTETRINRKDYGMVWNKSLDSGGVLLGDEVDITISLETVKQKPAEAKPAQ
ncbi:MAG TPA: YceI family protein [Thermoanaerobaculia bacterium]|nr:YceI family protein [Thermoanaerobaculia bacterium]